jgi:hypothetical protein
MKEIKIINEAQAFDFGKKLCAAMQGGKPIIIKYGYEKRNLSQNDLLHAIFEECAKKTGLKDAYWFKNELKNKLGLKEVHIDLDDMPTVIVVSTTKYNKKQMSDFIEKIIAYMAMNYQVVIETK